MRDDAIDIRRRRMLAGTAATCAAWPFAGLAQTPAWSPTRPVRILVAQTAGTSIDLLARMFAPRLQARMGQPFVVENRAGAAGAIGMEEVAKAPTDGHTININVSSTLTLPLFFKVPFDVLTGFTPISMVGGNLFALTVHSGVPATNAREFIAWAKGQGGKVNYGSPGNGTYHHLFMEQLKLLTGIDMAHVPYKGSSQAFNDLIGGQISTMFLPMGAALGFAKDGRVRILGGSGKERSPLTPDIPSLHEQGVTGYDFGAWFAAWGPPGLAPEIVARYNAGIREVMAEPEIRELASRSGLVLRGSTPEELDRINRAEYAALARLVREANIKGD